VALLTISFIENTAECSNVIYLITAAKETQQYLEKFKVLAGLEMRKQIFRVVNPNNEILHF
jgi:hypothetical protein